jgi:serine/threonine protein kinase
MYAIKVFFKSMLEQLAVAHSVGANNIDLQVNRNCYVDADGRAVLFDWNGQVDLGSEAADPHQNWAIAAPEAWLHKGYDIPNVLLTHVHAMDTWQAGIIWNNFLYAPCQWSTAYVLKSGRRYAKKQFVLDLIDVLGGNTIIPINNGDGDSGASSVDLRILVDLPPFDRNNTNHAMPTKFRTMLGNRRMSTCDNKPTWHLDDPDVPEKDKALALDLAQQMLRISPDDRPTMGELLQHPFLQF